MPARSSGGPGAPAPALRSPCPLAARTAHSLLPRRAPRSDSRLPSPRPPGRSLHQARRLLDAADRLPVEMRIALDLHARSEPDADWHSQLVAIHRLREIEGAYPVPRQQPAALQAADAALHAARKRAAEGRAAEGAPAPALPCHLQYTAGGSGSHRTAGCW